MTHHMARLPRAAGRALPTAILCYSFSQVIAASAEKYKLTISTDMVQFPSSLQRGQIPDQVKVGRGVSPGP